MGRQFFLQEAIVDVTVYYGLMGCGLLPVIALDLSTLTDRHSPMIVVERKSPKPDTMADEKKQNGVVTEGEQPFEVIPGTNLYVKNLDDGMDDEWLIRTFGKFGTITSAKVMRHQGGASKGFGFVCFSKPEEAEAAKTSLNGRMFGAKPLYINLAQKKEDRVAYLQEQFNNKNFGMSPTALDGWTAPAENGKRSTPPRTTVASPQQVKSSLITAKEISQSPVAMSFVRPSTLTVPQQVGGVNGYVLMGHNVGQPVAAPRPTGFIYAPTSAVQHPSVPVHYAWPAYGHPSVNTINQAQPLIGVRPTHHIHVAPANPAPMLLNHAAKIPHVHVGQQNNPAFYHQLQIPYGVGQSVNIPNVRVHPVGVATYPQAPSHSVWANGLG